MTNEQIAKLKRIVEGAPSGATHVDHTGVYYKHNGCIDYDVFMDPDSGACWRRMSNSNIECAGNIRSLDDLRTIIAQHEEIERLRGRTEYLESQIHNALAKNSMSYLLGEPPKGESE